MRRRCSLVLLEELAQQVRLVLRVVLVRLVRLVPLVVLVQQARLVLLEELVRRDRLVLLFRPKPLPVLLARKVLVGRLVLPVRLV